MTILWLDDMRNPFEDSWIHDYAPQFLEETIVWVKNYDSFVGWIKNNGLPHTIAFDHDLGEDIARETISGYDCAKWLVEYCIDNDLNLPNWIVQSANPVGKDNINGLLNNYLKHRNGI